MPDRSSMKRARVAIAVVACVLATGSARADTIDTCIQSSETAQRQRVSGHLRAARVSAAQCIDARCPAAIRRDCDALSDALARLTPTIVVRVRASDGTDLAAKVEVDGQPAALDGRAKDVDPGPHEVAARAPGYLPTQVKILVEEGVVARVVELHPVAVPVPPPVTTSRARSRTTWLASGALAAVGVAGIGLFAGLGLSTDADYRTLRDRCGDRCPPDDATSIRRRFQTADVALVAGLVALAGAVVVYVFGPRTSSRR